MAQKLETRDANQEKSGHSSNTESCRADVLHKVSSAEFAAAGAKVDTANQFLPPCLFHGNLGGAENPTNNGTSKFSDDGGKATVSVVPKLEITNRSEASGADLATAQKPAPQYRAGEPGALAQMEGPPAAPAEVGKTCASEHDSAIEDPNVRALKQQIVDETCKDVAAGKFSAKTQADWRNLFDTYKKAGFSQTNIEEAMKDLTETIDDKLGQQFPDSRPGVYAARTGQDGFALNVAYGGTPPKDSERPAKFTMGDFTGTNHSDCGIPNKPILEDPNVRAQIDHLLDETCNDFDRAPNKITPHTVEEWRKLYQAFKTAGFSPGQIADAFKELGQRMSDRIRKDDGPYTDLTFTYDNPQKGLVFGAHFVGWSPYRETESVRIDN
ncbi:MAG TPA: hypothetical protein V6C97_23665 [Oculatellaceae cyanobacterium]